MELGDKALPHWRQPGATYFVTFHLADSIPAGKRHELWSMKRDWERRHPPPVTEENRVAYAKLMFQQVEHWLEAGSGACWFREKSFADELHRSILHHHGRKYEIGCFVIMANHCHLTMRPFDGVALEREVGRIKQTVATCINRHRGKAAALWNEESYDRIVRDEEHLYRVIQYIGSNPRRIGLPREKWHRWINPVWLPHGWNFAD